MKLSSDDQLSGLTWFMRSMKYSCNIGITEDEKNQFIYDYNNKDLDKKCLDCNEYKEYMLQYSPGVRFMLDEVNKVGKFDTSAINCDVCDDTKGGGFHPDLGILLCANWIRSKYQLEDILTHELVHVYDYKKFDVDLHDLNHHACTEIRASMLSGECRIFQEIKKTGLGNFGTKFQDCIKRRAILSVSANPECANSEEAEKAVNRVWGSCFNDTRPFERVYR